MTDQHQPFQPVRAPALGCGLLTVPPRKEKNALRRTNCPHFKRVQMMRGEHI